MVAMVVTKCDGIHRQVNFGPRIKNIDEKLRNPVWTVSYVPLGPQYSAGIPSRTESSIYRTVYKVENLGQSNSANLDRIPVLT